MSAKNKQSNLIADDVEELEDEIDDVEEGDEETGLATSSNRGITAPKGRATPGRRAQEIQEEKSESGVVATVTSPFRSLAEYWEGVRSELQKVVWPTREETQRLAIIVLVVTIIASLVLGALSLLFNAIIAAGLSSPIVFGVILALAIIGFAVYLRTANRGSRLF
ncbi:MAG: preprotein translocase subunit SecE [Chloroflexi bacterium]|nr:preprotein translocase subunit SecE [Chloroflexota bacterium]MCC6896168.1 preprotein translocase subunit SecE [Anaerolineae bacterium]